MNDKFSKAIDRALEANNRFFMKNLDLLSVANILLIGYGIGKKVRHEEVPAAVSAAMTVLGTYGVASGMYGLGKLAGEEEGREHIDVAIKINVDNIDYTDTHGLDLSDKAKTELNDIIIDRLNNSDCSLSVIGEPESDTDA